jgi:sec-independent protein translocase protein TatB
MFPEGRILDFVIIGVLALIVVGPKDLPILMRRVGKFVAHMRSMAAEFRASFDEMARQSELDDLRREVEALRSGQSLQSAVGLGADSGVHEVFQDIHAGMRDGEPPAAPAVPPPATDGSLEPALMTAIQKPAAPEAPNPAEGRVTETRVEESGAPTIGAAP